MATWRCSPACSPISASTTRSTATYIAAHTTGFGQALFAASDLDLAGVAGATGLPARTSLRRFYSLFAATEKTVTVYSQGVNQSSSGTDKVNAIINCHLATGRIGKPGAWAVLGHRPAQRHGRPRGRRPGQHARRPYGVRKPRASRPRAALLERAGHRRTSPA